MRATPLLFLLRASSTTSLLNNSPARPVTVHTAFLLIETTYKSNVGAAARAIKTMGFSDLRLVAPKDVRVTGRKQCKEMASGATDVLDGAGIFENIENALASSEYGDVIVCGTGMPVDMCSKRASQKYYEPRKYFEKLLSKKNDKEVPGAEKCLNGNVTIAFLFGNEQRGMTPEDFEKCDVVLGVPTNPAFGSLNLASAVQLIAYDWRMALRASSSFEAL